MFFLAKHCLISSLKMNYLTDIDINFEVICLFFER